MLARFTLLDSKTGHPRNDDAARLTLHPNAITAMTSVKNAMTGKMDTLILTNTTVTYLVAQPQSVAESEWIQALQEFQILGKTRF